MDQKPHPDQQQILIGSDISSLSFSNDGSEAIHRTINIDEQQVIPIEVQISDKELEEQFELRRCNEWIKENNYQKPCLQFPDSLLKFSIRILSRLESLIGLRCYILADSTYGSCCIDEKTAKHVNGDCLIHFGQSCLTETNKTIPVLYIFTKPQLGEAGFNQLVHVFETNYPPTANTKILLLYDVIYQHVASRLMEALTATAVKSRADLICSELVLPGSSSPSPPSTASNESSKTVLYGRLIPANPAEFQSIFYIGSSARTILNFRLSSSLASKPFVVYNPVSQSAQQQDESSSSSAQNLTRLLMKRTYYVEKLKDSSTVGILVGTLAVEKYLAMIAHMKEVLKRGGKKVYIVSIGEITPPKLANFPDIQIFVLISCPECTILESKEFYQPIITPYEVELAFNQDREWVANIINDFRVLLPGGDQHIPLNMDNLSKPDVSLITGELRRQTDEIINWQGLNIDEESTASGILEGKTGIPRNYTSEPSTTKD